MKLISKLIEQIRFFSSTSSDSTKTITDGILGPIRARKRDAAHYTANSCGNLRDVHPRHSRATHAPFQTDPERVSFPALRPEALRIQSAR